MLDFTLTTGASVAFWQYDYGQTVELQGPGIVPGLFVQWSYPGLDGVDSRAIFEEDGVLKVHVPDELLKKTSGAGYVYIFDECVLSRGFPPCDQVNSLM